MTQEKAIMILNKYRNKYYNCTGEEEALDVANAINVILPKFIASSLKTNKANNPVWSKIEFTWLIVWRNGAYEYAGTRLAKNIQENTENIREAIQALYKPIYRDDTLPLCFVKVWEVGE